jgi:hypothetical protein
MEFEEARHTDEEAKRRNRNAASCELRRASTHTGEIGRGLTQTQGAGRRHEVQTHDTRLGEFAKRSYLCADELGLLLRKRVVGGLGGTGRSASRSAEHRLRDMRKRGRNAGSSAAHAGDEPGQHLLLREREEKKGGKRKEMKRGPCISDTSGEWRRQCRERRPRQVEEKAKRQRSWRRRSTPSFTKASVRISPSSLLLFSSFPSTSILAPHMAF